MFPHFCCNISEIYYGRRCHRKASQNWNYILSPRTPPAKCNSSYKTNGKKMLVEKILSKFLFVVNSSQEVIVCDHTKSTIKPIYVHACFISWWMTVLQTWSSWSITRWDGQEVFPFFLLQFQVSKKITVVFMVSEMHNTKTWPFLRKSFKWPLSPPPIGKKM